MDSNSHFALNTRRFAPSTRHFAPSTRHLALSTHHLCTHFPQNLPISPCAQHHLSAACAILWACELDKFLVLFRNSAPPLGIGCSAQNPHGHSDNPQSLSFPSIVLRAPPATGLGSRASSATGPRSRTSQQPDQIALRGIISDWTVFQGIISNWTALQGITTTGPNCTSRHHRRLRFRASSVTGLCFRASSATGLRFRASQQLG